MARRTVGFVQLEWSCPNCSTRNPGGKKTCVNCGAPQPENVKFQQPLEPKLVTDDQALRAARGGADIHCGFCGTRNPAQAVVCSQCGGDLKEGRQRSAGQEMQPAPAGARELACGNCGTENPVSNRSCSKCGSPLARPQAAMLPESSPVPQTQGAAKRRNWTPWLVAGGLALAACAAIVFLLFAPTTAVPATVSNVYWQTSILLQEMQSVSYSNERGSPPADAYDVSCRSESQEVCQEKTIDRGNGYAEVVQDCRTETEQYCNYRRDEWQTLQTYTEQGNNLVPFLAQPGLAANQRFGGESVEYTVTFQTDDGQKSYSPDQLSEFEQFEIGSDWTVRLNPLGGVVSVRR